MGLRDRILGARDERPAGLQISDTWNYVRTGQNPIAQREGDASYGDGFHDGLRTLQPRIDLRLSPPPKIPERGFLAKALLGNTPAPPTGLDQSRGVGTYLRTGVQPDVATAIEQGYTTGYLDGATYRRPMAEAKVELTRREKITVGIAAGLDIRWPTKR